MLRRRIAGALAVTVVAGGLSVLPFGPSGADDGTTTTTTVEPAPPPLDGRIDWNDTRQTIVGFGASGAFGQAARVMDYPEPDRTRILDLLFSRTSGAGLTILRHQFPVNFCRTVGYYDPTVDVGQRWLSKEAEARVGASDLTIMTTAWTAPAWMKSNFKHTDGGSVRYDAYGAYADCLANYVTEYERVHGITIDVISPTNEPDASTFYESMNWTGPQLRDFTRDYVVPVFQLRGVKAKYMIPENSYWSEDRAIPSLDDPAARQRVDIVAGHGYAQELDPLPFARSRAAGKQVWQTEMSRMGIPNDPGMVDATEWGMRMHRFMTRAEVNAFNSWWLFTEVHNTREALIDLDVPNKRYSVNKRLWAMGHYSRFVRPGWVRIGSPAGADEVTAFRDPATGEFAVVANNRSTSAKTLRLGLNGFAAPSVTPYVTTDGAGNDMVPGAPIDTSSGVVELTMPALSITTLTGTGTRTSPLAVAATDARAWTGTSTATDITVRNAGSGTATGTIHLELPEGVTASPAKPSFSVPAGGTTVVPVTLTPAAGAPAGAFPIEVMAKLDERSDDAVGHGQVTAGATLHLFDTVVAFRPGSADEGPWLADPGGSSLDGGARFSDGHASALYRFDLPPDVTGADIALDIDNQFKVRVSGDGVTWTTALESTVRDGTNRAVRTVDLDPVRGTSKTVWLRLEDAVPSDGWGGRLWNVRLDVTRSGS